MAASREVPATSVVYRGPVERPRDRSGLDTHTVLVSAQEFISSSAGGVMQEVFSDDLTGFGDISRFQDIYDEMRVLGLQVEYYPNNRYSKTTTICRPVITVVDRNDATVLASYSDACNASSSRVDSLEDPWVRDCKMNGIEDAQFLTTATLTAARNFVKIYADGLSASTEYGFVQLKCLVQFRGRK